MTNPQHNPKIRTLAAAHMAKDPDLSAIRRWKYGTVTGPVARLAGGATNDEYNAAAMTGQAFATWHSTRREVHYGKTGTSLGRALRQIGNPGAYGPSDPTARRLIDNLLAAATGEQLHRAVVAAMDRLRHVDHPPNWELLYTQLLDWQTPSLRNQVRLAWGQDFATAAPTPTTDNPDNN